MNNFSIARTLLLVYTLTQKTFLSSLKILSIIPRPINFHFVIVENSSIYLCYRSGVIHTPFLFLSSFVFLPLSLVQQTNGRILPTFSIKGNESYYHYHFFNRWIKVFLKVVGGLKISFFSS